MGCARSLARSCRSRPRCLVKPPRGAAIEGSRLLPVRVVASAAKPRRTTSAALAGGNALLEVALPSGARLRFPAGTDPRYLPALAAAL